jgi:predicted DNA binding CopG/RHH family protein
MQKKSVTTLKKLPAVKADAKAEVFVRDGDSSVYELSALQPTRFEFSSKDARLNMRLPRPLLLAIKAAAEKAGVPYQRFIRRALEAAIEPQR